MGTSILMKIRNRLSIKVWKYFILFSVLVFLFIWMFQVIFLKSYYKNAKTREIKEVAKLIYKNRYSYNISQIIDNINYDKNICVEITDGTGKVVNSSSFLSRGCLVGDIKEFPYREIFISSNLYDTTYSIKNPKFNNQILIYALKMDNDRYAFINTSIEPIDSTVKILKNQLIIVSIIVLFLSFIIAYFVSKKLADPIVSISKTAKRIAKGDFESKYKVDSNIEEIQELTLTLNHLMEEFSKTDQLRRDLMANVSHDLKTPLTMIKAYAEMARDLNKDNEERLIEDMNVIIDEADRLTILVNDILTLSKVQSELDKINYEEFDLVLLIKNILRRYKVYEVKDGYTFKFICRKKQVMVNTDKKKIEQVIYNLINNAVNYTGNDNKVTIRVTSRNSDTLVEIIDTGKGINEEDISCIFNKYYKVEKNHKRALVGTGLGLNIVKNIFDLLNIEYGVKTKKNKGSNFYFVLKGEIDSSNSLK